MIDPDAYQFGWSYAEMAVEPGLFLWVVRDWDEEPRLSALVAYHERRHAYEYMERAGNG